jgi:nitric oxide reductase NorQ protein
MSTSENDIITLLQTLKDKTANKPLDMSKLATSKPVAKTTDEDLPDWFTLSEYGKQVMEFIEGFVGCNQPVLLLGGTGMGKTVILQAIAKRLGRKTVGFNCYSGMDIQSLVGIWRPQTDGSLVWQDGVLTQGIKQGAIIRIEEYTRANPELKSRLFGILDSRDRYWSMAENGTETVEIPDETVIVASANPTGNGYVGTMREDKASMSRFAGVIEVYEPLADEHKALMHTLNHKDTVDRIIAFAELLRKDKSTYLSTRDLHFLATTFKRGVSPQQAIKMVLSPKYEGHASSIMTHARAVFEEMKDIEVVVESEV